MSLAQRVVAVLFAIILMIVSVGYNSDDHGGASVAALISAILLILWALRPRVDV